MGVSFTSQTNWQNDMKKGREKEQKDVSGNSKNSASMLYTSPSLLKFLKHFQDGKF